MCTDNITIITTVTTTTGLLLLLVVILIVVITSIVCVVRQKQHTRGTILITIIVIKLLATGVIDHVPVDDNAAYITMKRITLNKNTAYETVTVHDYETVNIASHYENVKITY